MALLWALAALGQAPAITYVGYLNLGSPGERAALVAAFREGLKEGGYIDGKDVAIEYRWAEGHVDRLPALAKELVERRVAVIAATGGLASALAAKSATTSIPIVFSGAQDPVALGLVASLSRPGGNVTGIANIAGELNAKRVQLLRDLVPSATNIAYLVDPNSPGAETAVKDMQSAAKATTTEIEVVSVRNVDEIDGALRAAKRKGAQALVVAATGGFFMTRRAEIVAIVERQSIPASYPFREFTAAGGLMSYGPHVPDASRQAGLYVARILKGAKPSELPVIQPEKFELVLNLATARKLGLVVPRDFLGRVDAVLE